MGMSKYLLDTNIYINFYDRYYRFDYFPSFWSRLQSVLNKEIVLPDIVIQENYQDETFRDWLSLNFNGAIYKHKECSDIWGEVIQHIAKCNFYSEKALTNDKSWAREKIADGWLIAIAKKENLTIVSSETRNYNLNEKQPNQSPKIPDIADDFGIRCIDMNTFFQEISLII